MALKPGRSVVGNGADISFYIGEVTTRGRIVTFVTSTTGLGEALDDADASVQVPTDKTGQAAGLLMNDVVNLDLTRQHLNQHKDEVQINSKATVLTDGWVVTNSLVAGETSRPGRPAFWDATGLLTTGTGSPQVGQFLSGRDADGYAKVQINVPMPYNFPQRDPNAAWSGSPAGT